MLPEEKLEHLTGIALDTKRGKLNAWELDFLTNTHANLRAYAGSKYRSPLSPKQKGMVFKILKKHNCHEI
jgi:hypothetical protein